MTFKKKSDLQTYRQTDGQFNWYFSYRSYKAMIGNSLKCVIQVQAPVILIFSSYSWGFA